LSTLHVWEKWNKELRRGKRKKQRRNVSRVKERGTKKNRKKWKGPAVPWIAGGGEGTTGTKNVRGRTFWKKKEKKKRNGLDTPSKRRERGNVPLEKKRHQSCSAID